MERGTPFLMYHELVRAGHALCRPEPGYARYCVPEPVFRAQLAALRALGRRGWSVGEALRAPADAVGTAITFDDGCETDLVSAAPALLEAGFGATFFVVSGWIGQPGFLAPTQLRELRALGFEIGAHSRTHAFLSDLAPRELAMEIRGAKDEIEQVLGEPVLHFSCPGGRWSPAVSAVAREAGYASVSTSRMGVARRGEDPFRLPRTAILDGMSSGEFATIAAGRRRWLREAQDGLLAGAKRVLGNGMYERVRGTLLRR